MVVVCALSLALSWEYSAPPLRLHSRGLGPATAAIVVGGLTPLAGYGMQGGPWSRDVLLCVLPTVIAQFALILVLDFPDAEGDARAGKRTLVVLFGPARATGIAVAAVSLVYIILPLLVLAGARRHLVLAVAATLPFGAWLGWTLLRRASWQGGGAGGPLAWRGVLWFAVVSLAELAGTVFDLAWS
jgi:1,4-dihydroxy-2-naphthoate octaprenyltransferase